MTAYWILRSLEFPWEREGERERDATLSMLFVPWTEWRMDGNGENSETRRNNKKNWSTAICSHTRFYLVLNDCIYWSMIYEQWLIILL